MDIKKILFYVVIVLVIYSLYKWLFRDPASSNLLDMGSAKEETIIKSEKIKKLGPFILNSCTKPQGGKFYTFSQIGKMSMIRC